MALSRTSHYSASWIRSHYRRLEGLPAPHQAWTAADLEGETREMLRGLRAHDIIHSCGWDDGRREYETDPAAYRAIQEHLESDDSDSPLPCDCPFRIRRHAETIECLDCGGVYDAAAVRGGGDE